MISIWYKNDDFLVLRAEEQKDWYLKWNFTWKCWTVAGWNHYQLVSGGWEQRA
jgi:hypothetical protein